MAKTRYWGRFKIGRKWSDLWHLIDGVKSRDEALGNFIKNTRYTPQQVQITTTEPPKYAGRKK